MKIRKNKGITLISLVVTIIILLILAGISLHLLLGDNGILSRAKYAKERYANEQAYEIESLDNLYEKLLNGEFPENTKETEAGTIVAMPNEWYTTTPNYVETQTGEIIKRSTKVASVYAVATGNGESVPVPIGFYYVGGTIASGVVISDNKEDANKYKDTEGGNVPAGVEYNDDGTVNTETSELKGNQFVWIPVTESEYKKTSWDSKYQNATWETQTNLAELVQIRKYGGFYVGRYEAGTSNIKLSSDIKFENKNTATNWINDSFSIRNGKITATGSITCKAGEIPYYHADYFTALTLCRNMYQSNYIQSGLVTGTMWDAMMNFIAGGDTSIVTTASTWGNYNAENSNVTYTAGQGRYATVNSSNGEMTSAFQVSDGKYYYGIRTTASTEGVKKKNLYDVAGNLYEWTQEAAYRTDGIENYMLRSGSFSNANSTNPVCYRGGHTATDTHANFGFRPALFIM